MERVIKAKPLSDAAFKDFGTFADFVDPEGYSLSGTYHKFYRDQIRCVFDGPAMFVASPLVVKKNADFIVTGMEYHDHTDEIQLPINADAVLVCAPANGGDIAIEEAEAFIIPQGTVLSLKRGTWHDVLYPVNADSVSVLIGLPERVYNNDIVIKSFGDDHIKVEF